jgi:Ser/Thr protein kinase RdoA (MazF antagonist)
MHTQFMLDFPWKRITQAWPQLACALRSPLSGGLINRTLRMSAKDGLDYVLQWLNPVFPPTVSADVAAVTQHLQRHGIPTFSVLPTREGEYYLSYDVGSFRLLTYLEGDFLSPSETADAGATLAAFHRAMANCAHIFSHDRNIHRPREHAKHLHDALQKHRQHRLFDAVAALAGPALAHLEKHPGWDALPARIVHGDPNWKISGAPKNGVTLLDLDTVGRHCVLGELGDADAPCAARKRNFHFLPSMHFFANYMQAAPGLTPEEIRRIPERSKPSHGN